MHRKQHANSALEHQDGQANLPKDWKTNEELALIIC